MTDTPLAPDLEALRQDLHRFMRELALENYMHYSGQKETLEIAPIYERYGHLVSKDLAKNVRDRWRAAQSPEEKRSYKHLHHFAFFGYQGNLIKGIIEEIARRQNEMSIRIDGREIGYHSIVPRLTNEPDCDIRREIDDRASELELELNELRLESWKITSEVFREFGYESYAEGCRKSFEIDYDGLAAELRGFLDETEDDYVRQFDYLATERLGYSIRDARKCDLGYLMRGEGWDGYFPKDGMVGKATACFAEMGMPVDEVPAIILDVEEREKKRPRAFCSPVEVGREVYVCTRPMGGMSDYLTFLHELGHAYHFAYTDPNLPAELILVGDSATSEVFAFNFNYLGADGLWLKTYLGIDDPAPIVRFLKLQKLYFLRRYASKLLFELELHSDWNMEKRAGKYTEYLDRGLIAKHRIENWLSDLDPAFYSAGYLRAWIFERQLREYLIEEFGDDWWRNPESGRKLAEFWRTGRMYMPEEMSERILGEPLDLGPIKRELTDLGEAGPSDRM